MKTPFVSLIIPHYDNDLSILERVLSNAINQDYINKEIILIIDNPKKDFKEIPYRLRKEIKIIKNPKNLGLAGSLNRGIKEAKGEIIITLLEDCVPKNKFWVNYLLKYFKDTKVVAVGSTVINDKETFKKYDPIIKDLMNEGKRPLRVLDEKGCAYDKEALKKVGFFDSAHFKTAGEDFDMFYKLSKLGKIILGSKAEIIHIHPLNLRKFYKRVETYASSSGVLDRVYPKRLLKIKQLSKKIFPIWGILKGIKTPVNYSHRKLKIIIIYIKANWIHLVSYIKSFIKGKQE